MFAFRPDLIDLIKEIKYQLNVNKTNLIFSNLYVDDQDKTESYFVIFKQLEDFEENLKNQKEKLRLKYEEEKKKLIKEYEKEKEKD